MTLLITIAVGVPALVCYMVIARMVAGHTAHMIAAHYIDQHGKPDSDDWVAGIVTGVGWPIAGPIWLIVWAVQQIFAHTPPMGQERVYLRQQERQRVAAIVRDTERHLLDP